MKFIIASTVILVTTSFVLGVPLHKEVLEDDDSCKDERKECPKYAALKGYCLYEKEFMKKYCRQSCGFCQPNPVGGAGDCRDKIPRCAEHAAREGYCDYNKDFMKIYCKKSCNFCGEIRSPEEPKETPFKWVRQNWGPCKDGTQERDVKCYHKYEGKFYHVAIFYCKNNIGAEEPVRKRPCV